MNQIYEAQRIYDIGISHGKSLDAAKNIIDYIALYDPQAWIKLQYFCPDKLWKTAPMAAIETNLSAQEIRYALDYASNRGLKSSVTVFRKEEIPLFFDYIDFVKIASPDIVDYALLREYARFCRLKNKPILISTGGASIDEIYTASQILPFSTLMFCLSKYPAHPGQFNLGFLGVIQALASVVGCSVGLSDHSIWGDHAFDVTEECVKRGALFVEKHIELSQEHPLYFNGNPDSSCCIPAERSAIERFIKSTSLRKLVPDHMSDRINVIKQMRKYAYAAENFKRGQIIEPDLVSFYRGMSTVNVDQLSSNDFESHKVVATRDLSIGAPLSSRNTTKESKNNENS